MQKFILYLYLQRCADRVLFWYILEERNLKFFSLNFTDNSFLKHKFLSDDKPIKKRFVILAQGLFIIIYLFLYLNQDSLCRYGKLPTALENFKT